MSYKSLEKLSGSNPGGIGFKNSITIFPGYLKKRLLDQKYPALIATGRQGTFNPLYKAVIPYL